MENPEQLRQYEKHFRLLTPANRKKNSFSLEVRVTGYNDTMHYMAHLIKVCIMALEAQDSVSSPYIPEPNVNISSVMELLLNMIPYEETELLDELYAEILRQQTTQHQ
jgi:hypothetical protein